MAVLLFIWRAVSTARRAFVAFLAPWPPPFSERRLSPRRPPFPCSQYTIPDEASSAQSKWFFGNGDGRATRPKVRHNALPDLGAVGLSESCAEREGADLFPLGLTA